MITCYLDTPAVRQCFQGYVQALELAGSGSSPELIATASVFTVSAGYESAQSLLDSPNPPTAIFAAGDLLAIGAMQAAKEWGLNIPHDIALVGYNDLDLATLVEPPLTTVAAPIYDLGVVAAHMLQQLINEEPAERQRIVLPTQLVIRRTCGCSRAGALLHP